MYLQSVEISGFKTFPDKTVLTAESGITAVVGPNGSGKSNIGDSIRWVLGEQNPRNLRCEKKMEEVIFHGTSTRGPLHFAEVTLVLHENADEGNEGELRITRRLFRSGESEYYINKNAVRLKDISELLMDTGLGPDGYSIIGQGRIGKILSDKSGDRRRVFEEACGISKYRHRKEEAERKLSNAEDNLTRIGDKISELELQVEPLRQQSETARRFLLLRDELRTLEIAVWLENLDKLKANFSKVRAEYEEVCGKLAESARSLEALYARSESLSEHNTELSLKAERERETLSALEAAAGQKEAESKVLEAQKELGLTGIQRLREELDLQEGRESALLSQLKERERELAGHEAALEMNRQRVEKFMHELEELSASAGDVSHKLLLLRQKEENERGKAEALERDISGLTATNEELTLRKAALIREHNAGQEAYVKAKDELSEAGKALKVAEEQIDELRNVVQGYTMQKTSREKKATALRERNQQEQVALGALESRFALLSEMEREHEGFGHAVKLVLSPKSGLGGIHGTVADLIHTEDEYTIALETALGAALQNIVVTAEEDARAAINLLKQRDSGRATFLPLSSVRGRKLEEKGLENEPGFVGLGVDIVKTEERYAEVFASLLGRTAVVRDLDAGIALAKKRSYRFRIVTLDGQVLNAGGAITGGSLAKQTGILSRKNELAALSGKIEKAKASRQALQADLQNAERELNAVVFEMEVALEQRRVAEAQAAAARSDVEHRESWLASMESTQNTMQTQLQSINLRLMENGASINSLREQAESCVSEAETFAREQAALQASHEGLAGQNAGLQEKLNALREENAALQGRYDADKKSVQDFAALREELSGDRGAKEEAIRRHERESTELLEKLAVLQKEASEAVAAAEQQKRVLKAVYDEQQGLEGQRVQCERAIRDANEENTRYERDRARMENQKNAAENEEKQILDRLWETYELSHSAAQALRVELPNLQKAVRRIAEIKREITALGAVNVGAIEEFERVNTRFEYLTNQRDDAARAKKELEGIIAEITEAMRSIFAEQFTKINEHFIQVFHDIFGGGSAALELEDPDDILNCGVEIKAQPPGKKLRAITLLSGGEMSLVAIALYFAIFKVRPSPFCVLDEIDHDLDDVNVARFARYLKTFSDTAQFLVVTHRRGTMEVADLLYGVTAQEEGVSKILALRLADVEKELGI